MAAAETTGLIYACGCTDASESRGPGSAVVMGFAKSCRRRLCRCPARQRHRVGPAMMPDGFLRGIMWILDRSLPGHHLLFIVVVHRRFIWASGWVFDVLASRRSQMASPTTLPLGPRQPITSGASSLHRRLPQRGRAMTDAMHRPLQLHGALRLRHRSQVRNRHERRDSVKTGDGWLENPRWSSMEVLRFPFRGHPCNTPGRLGRAMHPNSVATLTPISGSGVSLPDGQRSRGSGVGSLGWTSRGKGIFDPLPSCFRHQHHPPPSSSLDIDVDVERVQRHTRPLCPPADTTLLACIAPLPFTAPVRRASTTDLTCLDVDWSRPCHELQPRPTDSSLSIGLTAHCHPPPTAHRLPNLRLLRGLYNNIAVPGPEKGRRTLRVPSCFRRVCVFLGPRSNRTEPNEPSRRACEREKS